MGSDLELPTFTELFEKLFPFYLSIGMTYDQFWEDDPKLARYYYEAYEIKRDRENEWLWLQGVYIAESIKATVGNMFSKGNKYKYPKQKLPLTTEQKETQDKEEYLRKTEAMKQKMILMTKRGGKNAN